MAKSFIFGVVLFAALCPGSALAQEDIVDRNIEYFVETSGGKPIGCGVEFIVLYVDHNSGDRTSGLDGSLTNFIKEGSIITLFKVAGFDFPDGTNQPSVSFRINNATLDVNGKLFEPIPFKCSDANHFCGNLNPQDGLIVLGALAEQGIQLKFNRKIGDLDYNIDISGQPGKNQDPQKFIEQVKNFLDCSMNIADQMKDQGPPQQ